MTPTTDDQRVVVEKLRLKAENAYIALTNALDHGGHDEDCVLRCLVEHCHQLHSCDVCREDGEV